MRFFNIHSVAKHEKLEEQKFFIFGKKSHNAEKTEKDRLGFFNNHSVAKHQQNAGGTLWGKISEKMSRSGEKKLKGGTLWCCPVWYVTRKNKENLFGPVR